MRNMLLILCVPLLLLVNACKDPCKKVECLNNGICVEGNCLCQDNYIGEYCETNLCLNVVCQNGGTCIDGICDCPEGFVGNSCETDLCAGINCQNGGNCVNGICNCPYGFSGIYCEIDNCAGVSCINGEECVNGNCECPQGRTGVNCADTICTPMICADGFYIAKALLYIDDNMMNTNWDPSNPFGVGRPDIHILAWREGYNRQNCHGFEFNRPNEWDVTKNEIPLEWFPQEKITENASYHFEVGDHDAAACPDKMYTFSGTLGRNMPNPIILAGGHPDRRLEIYWYYD